MEPGAARIFGLAEAEAVGRSLDIIIPENLRERHWQGYRATMRTGQSRYGDSQILSVAALRKDGTRVSVEFTIVPFTDDAGRMIGIAAIMRGEPPTSPAYLGADQTRALECFSSVIDRSRLKQA